MDLKFFFFLYVLNSSKNIISLGSGSYERCVSHQFSV